MALFHMTTDRLEAVPETSFSGERIFERKDLQRLLRADTSPLGEELLVVAEEFSEWEDSARRIDLLCIDKKARLVVVELKRTSDGGHMELQAIRYAAMVASMTLDSAIARYAKSLSGDDVEAKARREVLEFLEADSLDGTELTGDVRIILVSENFSTELTTAVMWLNKHDLDVTCIRLRPYKFGERLLVDASQIIPLPEAADYEIKVRAQAQETKKARTARQELFRRFWAQLIDKSRAKTQLLANRSTTTDHWLSAGVGRAGFHLSLSVTEDRARVECYIRLGKVGEDTEKKAYHALLSQKSEIETAFGDKLDWQELPGRLGSRICKDIEEGWRTPEDQWPSLKDRMIELAIRLERALREPIRRLQA